MTAVRHLPLIVGSSGRLGRALAQVIESEHPETFPEAVFATRTELDLTDDFRLRWELERTAPTVVVNCAAYADVDGCEAHPETAEMVNAEGARHLARAARQIQARIIQLSTDLVFDGAAGRPYREEDETRPLSRYAVSKLDGERSVQEENPDHVILRSSWFFGPWPLDRYPEVFLRALKDGRSLSMVADRIGSPTYLKDLARAIVRLILTPYQGVLHFANAGEPTSRFHLLRELAVRLGIDTERLTPIHHAQWLEDVAARPVYSALDSSRYARVTGSTPRPWADSLEDYVRERDA